MTVGYRWDVEAFLRAHEAGVFDGRVELVDGEVWPVVIGDWHAWATGRCAVALGRLGDPLLGTLATGGSLPDPDVWVRRPGARPTGQVSERLSRWDSADVLLVVEVSDETLAADLTVKAGLYARSGYARYWVVARDGVHEYTDPTGDGYRQVRLVGRGGWLPMPGGAEAAVNDLLPPDGD